MSAQLRNWRRTPTGWERRPRMPWSRSVTAPSTPACGVRSWGAPGKRVWIKGTGFLPDDAVYFGTLPADHVVLDAARGRLRATVPAGATSGNVWVISTTGLTASSPNVFRIR
jgi:hypothetical protein